ELGSVLVTSAVEKEGRSTIAWHLAAAAATGGQRVLLLEADIRAPVFARRYGLRTGPGLAEILEGRSEVNDAIQWVAVAGPAKGHSSDGVLDVIVAGSTAQTPAALLENGAMRELLDGLIADHDLVVIDAPAALQVADAMPLLRRVDGVLVVGRVGLTTPDQARRLSEQLRDLDAPTLGLVANSVRREESSRHAYPSSTSLRQPANGASAPGSAARAR
ncbi:MAG: CpsD/CapB family tyrosine-protein kinase, partial [Solirubrobacterales bacterium]|nr:CpsD/CapB family tyrosine-protein kinase [Solirubrobacterales bacterium]MBV9472103.1 CpsD/CapB family tyrosine-protein kinase [Solirubrobacterales bacterium]